MATKTLLGTGASVGDPTAESLRDGGLRLNNLQSATYVCSSSQFGGATAVQIIQNTINQAVTDGVTRVLVPQQDNSVSPPVTLLPYNASLITFNAAIQMLREGGDMVNFDALAYGADRTGVTDASVSIQAAIAAAAAVASGNPSQFGANVYLPHGTYKVSSPLQMPVFVGMYGDGGEASILKAPGDNDMIQFTTFADVCSVTFRDFGIVGNPSSTSAAMKFLGTANVSDWLSGLHIYRLRITDYQTAFRFRTLHQSTIRENWVQRCNVAVDFRGSNLTNWIERNTFIYAGGCGTGVVTAIRVDGTSDYNPGGNTLAFPESVHINSNLLYGFQQAVDMPLCTFASILDNDINATVTCIQFASCNGVLNIKYNYMEGGAATGIQAVGLSSIINTKVNIEGNHAIGTGGVSSLRGIRVNQFGVNSNQTNISIVRNSFSGWTNNDIDIGNAGNIVVEDNHCFSGVAANNSIIVQGTLAGRSVIIDKNRCTGNIFVDPTNNLGPVIVGANYGAFSTLLRGTATIPNTATTVTVTFASLPGPPPNFDTTANTGLKFRIVLSPPNQNVGVVTTPSYSATGFPINSTVAAQAGGCVIPWEMGVVQSNY